MTKENIKQEISEGLGVLGIELGSTRIKAVLVNSLNEPVASGSHSWENRFENGIWTYHLDDVWAGIEDSYKKLCEEVKDKFDTKITKLKAIGFSAMMHGYLVFDKNGKQLAQFRTWRNTMTEESAQKLTEYLGFNIPQRWSIAHLYQAILNNEEHIKDIAFQTTLAGYVHFMLTGRKVLGVGEASGVFPVDSNKNDYDENMVDKFDKLLSESNMPYKLRDILPEVLCAGDEAGTLASEGAKLLDPSGELQPGCPLCAPEGDAGTGMVATNSVRVRTGNVSAGTSIFAMAVLEKSLCNVYTEIDMVTTPTGKPVAMVHCNNCCSEIDAWVNVFRDFVKAAGFDISTEKLYNTLFEQALLGEGDCGGVVLYNYLSGEPVTKLAEGRPLLVRTPDANFNLPNFFRAQLYSAMATLKIGMDILFDKEGVVLDKLMGHGGLFKTENVGQKLMAGAMNTPVCVMETAGEGGAWGIALLASYLVNKSENENLEDYLDQKVFCSYAGKTVNPDINDVDGFAKFIKSYIAGLETEKSAVENFRIEEK